MRITIVTGAFLPVPPIMGGAVEKIWHAMGGEFVRRGHEVTHVSRAVDGLAHRETRDGVEHVRVAGYDTPAALWRLKLLDLFYSLRAWRALPAGDILVTNTFWLPLLARGARSGKLYVHVARAPKGQMRFYGNAARLQTPSSVIASAIAREAPALAGKVVVIPYAAPTHVLPEEPAEIEERARTILFVGRLHPEKGVHFLIEAFMQESEGALRDWKLEIVGPTDVAQGGGGEEYASELRGLAGGSEKVIFRGPIFETAELERAYRGTRLFVYPSLAETGETFGLAALEAMSHRCAVLVSNLGCFHDFVHEGETGAFFDHRAPAAARSLQEKMVQMLQDESALERMAEAGWRKADDYALGKVADRFLQDFAAL
ncbi:MAG: glycosyltransferase family 4 protein [Chthoniobacterales bacterium]